MQNSLVVENPLIVKQNDLKLYGMEFYLFHFFLQKVVGKWSYKKWLIKYNKYH